MILITLLCSVILQLQVVPMASAHFGPREGPIIKECTVYLWDSYYDEVVATVTMYMKYYIWLYYLDIQVTEVAVTINYVWQRFYGYMRLDSVGLETGIEPWNTGYCVTFHWTEDVDDYYYWNHNDQGPMTYEADPNVFFDLAYGQTGQCGIIKVLPPSPHTWRLVADGNYLYVDTDLRTDFTTRMQFAWQFQQNVVIIYRNRGGWVPDWVGPDVWHFYDDLSV